MLPIRTPDQTFRTLVEIRRRKEELCTNIQNDNEQFTKLWGTLFVKKGENNKSEWISSLIANSITAVDTFLLARKLIKKYGHFFVHKKK